VIDTFGFTVRVTLDARTFDPATLAVRLNDEVLETSGGPNVFTSAVDPGPPLLDDNTLTIEVQRLDGSTATATSAFRYLPPKARAREIVDASDLLSGPLAHGRIGDYHLGNAVARFVIQDVAQRDLWSVGAFGGNIIDAELIDHPGLENFLEIQPGINAETVVNAQTLDIINDGQDGTAAVIRTCGPDDVLDFVNPSTIIEDIGGLDFPDDADDKDYDIEACTDYILEPGKPYVKMVTTVANQTDGDLRLRVGDYINASGELEPWTSGAAGIGEMLVNSLGVFSYIGYDAAAGVDYYHITLPLPGATNGESTFFTAAGVSYVLHSDSTINTILGVPPFFVVPANGTNSFTRFFGVGDGSGGNAIDVENEVKGVDTGTVRGCVTVAGEPAPGSRVAVGTPAAGPIQILRDIFVTDAEGCFSGTLSSGDYAIAASRRGTPFEGGGTAPLLHRITVTVRETFEQNFDLPATGRLHVQVTDENGEPLPARVSVVGFDPSPEPVIVVRGPQGDQRTGLFNDAGGDPEPFGVTRVEYAGADGMLEIDIEPSSYQVFVSRGCEYSSFDTPVTVESGQTATVTARIARVVDTTGFVSSDFHVHGINSADSRVGHVSRAKQFAGEGIDNIVNTDHHSHTDLNPVIDELDLTPFVHATTGEEITTWDYGHFNAYPLLIDPDRPSGGSTDWAKAEPAGRDFVAYGAYSLPPSEIAALATEGPTSTPDTVIQINHINSHFDPLRINTSLVPPQSFITPTDLLRFRLDPESGNLFHHFLALELWNGAGRGAQQDFQRDRIGIWFNHLNQGLISTAIADTDTHELRNLNSAGARTWTAAPADDPPSIDGRAVARSVKAGRAVGGQGLYVQTRLRAMDGSENVADLTLAGSTIVATTNGAVELQITVQAPLWAEFDRIDIFANASTMATFARDGIPILFTAEPTRTLRAGDDFEVETVNVFPDVPGAMRRQTTVSVPFENLAADTWFVVLVKGTDGVSRPMFPEFPRDIATGSNTTLADLLDGNLGENGVMALGFTNALYADVDGVEGFQAPLAQ
jgi:hypothetical protein